MIVTARYSETAIHYKFEEVRKFRACHISKEQQYMKSKKELVNGVNLLKKPKIESPNIRTKL